MYAFPRAYYLFGIVYCLLKDVMMGVDGVVWDESDKDTNYHALEVVGVGYNFYTYNKYEVLSADEVGITPPKEKPQEHVKNPSNST